MTFVLDCSVAVSWVFPDEATAFTKRVRGLLADQQAIVPALWRFEVANALLVGEKRKRVTAEQSISFLEMLDELPIRIDPDESMSTIRDAAILARRHGLTAYDAAYLELALRLEAPLATLDEKLLAAAARAGVPPAAI